MPRVKCPEHGVVTTTVPWAEPNSGFTALFEALVIDWLKEASTSAVARLMGLSWNAIDGIMQRAVKRGLARRKKTYAQHLGVDETAFRKRHDYVSIVSDQDNGTVLYVGKDRKKADLKQWFEALPRSCLEAIESVSMDMWPAFINATLEMVPGAESKNRLRQVPCGQISWRGGRQGAPRGAQETDESRQGRPQGNEVRLVVQSQEHDPQTETALQGAA